MYLTGVTLFYFGYQALITLIPFVRFPMNFFVQAFPCTLFLLFAQIYFTLQIFFYTVIAHRLVTFIKIFVYPKTDSPMPKKIKINFTSKTSVKMRNSH